LRQVAAVLVLLTILLSATAGTGQAAGADDPVLPAKAYVLIDATTGQVLYAYHGDEQLPVASTTKILTAILALERGNLDDIVTVGQKPYDTGGTTIWLEVGEQQTLHDLLLALMLESANDAAVAIAEHLAGSEAQFVGWMNDKARELGATHTHFANSHGLQDPDHYSTARDLALIARYAMRNQTFRNLVSMEEATIPGYKDNPSRHLVSHNRLLGYYEGANGIKNGFTEEAGLTNVASARRGDTELIAVVLGAQSQIWTSSMALLDFGFSHYDALAVVEKGSEGTDNSPATGAGDDAVGGDSTVPTVAPTPIPPTATGSPAPGPAPGQPPRPFTPELLLILGGAALVWAGRRRRTAA
jgi:D-alanyl-D-alanine carboxypeptidase (penicillin-binding protein 5/6)